MAKKKKKPFQDARGKWYAILGKKKPRPYSERALKKALMALWRAKREAKPEKVTTGESQPAGDRNDE